LAKAPALLPFFTLEGNNIRPNYILVTDPPEDVGGGYPVVINCIKYHTEYRLNRELLREATKGMQVHCRECDCCFDALIIPSSLQDDEATEQVIYLFATNSAI